MSAIESTDGPAIGVILVALACAMLSYESGWLEREGLAATLHLRAPSCGRTITGASDWTLAQWERHLAGARR